MIDPENTPDPHFGSDEEMKAWADREGLELIYEDGDESVVDWTAVYASWIEKQGEK